MSEASGKKSLKEQFGNLSGMPLWLYALCAVIVLSVMFTGALGKDLTAFIAVGSVLSVLFYKVGKVIRVWDKYIGGGLLMIFFGSAIVKQFALIPEDYIKLCSDMIRAR